MKNRILILSAFLLLTIIMCNGVSAADSNDTADIDAQIMNVDVPFVENQGQTDEEVSYYAKTFYGTSYVTQDSVTHQIQGKNNTTLVLKEQFLDSNGNPIKFQATGEEPSNTTVSYFKGNDPNNWQTNLPTYNLINLGEIYPGIIIKLRATGSNIEKLFFISPGANPENIRIQILGADQLQTDEKGNLNIKSSGFEQVSLSPPKAYQDKNDIEANYQTNGNTYQFQIGNYDHNQELIIDPTLEYSTYLGGTNDDYGVGIAVDNSGSAYITGYTYSTDFPTTTGAYQTTYAGNGDVFVTKINPTGTTLQYSTYLGGNSYDHGYGIAVDNSGSAYITGETSSTNFPTTTGAYQTTNAGNIDAFVTKINPTGTTLQYSTYLGGNHYDYGLGIAVDNSGSAYITGFTYSTNFPTTTGAYQTTYAGNGDVFVTKINPTGTTLQYSTYLGGNSYDHGYGIAVDNSGSAYITGETSSTNFPTTTGAYQTTNAGNIDAFVTKINPTGTTLQYSTYLGGNHYDYGLGIAVDNSGSAYITGFTYSTNFPTTTGAYQTTNAGSSDAFVTKINPTGTTLQYSSYLGGNSYDHGWGIAVDDSGSAYITGETYSTDFPTTTGAYQTTYAGSSDAFVTKINPTGTTLEYSTYLGGTGYDLGRGIAVDNSGSAYITGYTYSTNFPTTTGAYQTTNAGSRDAFIAKLDLKVETETQTQADDKSNFAGQKIDLTATVTDFYGDNVNEGQVNFSVNGGVVGTVNVVNGLATYTWTIPTTWTPGDYSILADYLGTSNYLASADTATLTINPTSSVYLTITGKENPVVGDTVTYTLKVGNRGPDPAENVVMTYTIPEGLEYTGAAVDVGTFNYDPATRTLTWTIGEVPVGDPYMWLDLKILKAGRFLINPRLSTSTYDPTLNRDTQSLTVNAVTPTPDPTPQPVHGKTVPMQKTGTPLAVLALAVLMVLGGIVSTKK